VRYSSTSVGGKRGVQTIAVAIAAQVEAGLKDPDVTTLVSPAVAEKKLKKLPDGLTVSVSSGNTMAPDSDPRPAILQLGQLLQKVL